MKSYQVFIFKKYYFDPVTSTLTCDYSYDDEINFQETFQFKFPHYAYNPEALDRAVQLLFFMAGVSYYKMYLAPEVKIEMGEISDQLAAFLNTTYRHGLGEFCYVNKLDLVTDSIFVATIVDRKPVAQHSGVGMLIGLGGGKDSLVSVEVLRGQDAVSTWSVGHESQLTPLVSRIGLPHYWVERMWDRAMLEHNNADAYNGHVPISAILACAGIVTAVLTGKRDIVVSNEHSANEPTLTYQGVPINHQYSKSQAFETELQALLQTYYGDSIRYYSLLRPFSELRIAEIFSSLGFTTYHDVFSSCNRAFVHDQTSIYWDGSCPKCAFVFLVLSPFIPEKDLMSLFGGKNLLLDPTLRETYEQILGISGDKPLECVGEVKESRAAMRMAQSLNLDIQPYDFELPADYDFRAWQSDSMPPEVRDLLKATF